MHFLTNEGLPYFFKAQCHKKLLFRKLIFAKVESF